MSNIEMASNQRPSTDYNRKSSARSSGRSYQVHLGEPTSITRLSINRNTSNEGGEIVDTTSHDRTSDLPSEYSGARIRLPSEPSLWYVNEAVANAEIQDDRLSSHERSEPAADTGDNNAGTGNEQPVTTKSSIGDDPEIRFMGRVVSVNVISCLIQITAFIIFIGKGICDSATNSGVYMKVCRFTAKRMYPDIPVDCSLIENYLPEFQNQVVKDNSEMNIFIATSGCFVPCFMSLILSAWGDRVGRKTNMLLGSVGMLLLGQAQIIYLAVSDAYEYLLPILTLLLGFSGLHFIVGTSCIQYIADVGGNSEFMVFRAMMVAAACKLGTVVGNAICGAILKVQRFTIAIVVGQIFIAMGMAMMLVFFQQRPPPKDSEDGNRNCKQSPDMVTPPKQSFLKELGTILAEIGQTYAKPRPMHRRLVFWLILAALCLSSTGEVSFTPTYLLSPPLSYQPYQVSVFQFANGAIIAIGSTALSICGVLCKIRDTTLATISLTSLCVSKIPLALANQKWQPYLGPILGCCGYLFYGSYQAAIAKILAKDETGKGLAGETIGTGIAAVVGDIVLNKVYGATAGIFNGAAWLVSAAFVFLALLCSIAVVVLSRPLPEMKPSQDNNLIKKVFHWSSTDPVTA